MDVSKVVNKIFKHKYLTPEFFFLCLSLKPIAAFCHWMTSGISERKKSMMKFLGLRPHLPDCWETVPLEEEISEMRK